MKRYNNLGELATDMKVDVKVIESELNEYNRAAKGEIKDKWNKVKFVNTPFTSNEVYHVIVITPLIHYTMGGIGISINAEVEVAKGKTIPGLFAAGEVAGGVHGINRLGGTSLLDCVAYGRIAGRSACTYLLDSAIKDLKKVKAGGNINAQGIFYIKNKIFIYIYFRF